MKAKLRFGIAVFAAGLWLGSPALAQDAAQPTCDAPPTDTVGPRELQNFSLDGKVTRPAQPVQPSATAPGTRAPAAERQTAPRSAASRTAAPQQTRQAPSSAVRATRPAVAEGSGSASSQALSAPASSLTLSLPPAADAEQVPAGAVAEPGFAQDSTNVPADLAPETGLALWPWLLLAALTGGAAALFLWRRRPRETYAGGPHIDLFVAPEPAPPPRPVAAPPPPPKATPSKPVGIVSTKFRPWLEVSFKPLRCVVEQEKVTLDFEVEVLNSGAAPARDISVEACMVAAGPSQEQEIARFFAKPAAPDKPVAVLPPMQRLNLRSSLVASRSSLPAVDVGGRSMIVPVMAFNAMYRWSGGQGKTSTSELLGRATKGEKLAPFRADLAPRAYSSLDTRRLPLGARQ